MTLAPEHRRLQVRVTLAPWLILVLLVPSTAAGGASLTATGVSHMIAASGARATLNQLVNDSPRFYQLLGDIGGGRLEWLVLAEQFWPVSEGYSREMLLAAVSGALERRPEAVLRLSIPTDLVCGDDPLRAISRITTHGELLRALRNRDTALESVRALDLQSKKTACLAAIAELKGKDTRQP
jgi:hypothetical protein